ncbi:hypothetical protein M406DRAFT_72519 [Cryphonectria parasitica EP155]|uniref:Uncharacterized protein n=1 Tax=Cryphonectria parasitica (strain ATCC 38755 / EP155) TaxID=660469 RepID=A0A9P4XX42_CRYP1|nr:uncharacterized protein M406DRAFT_72519 [Cryphonectria parasitica EP155]KAF3762518.1 hypothetical protein M406DRAFT_72519 [Cryphonectria parasitica EP155]
MSLSDMPTRSEEIYSLKKAILRFNSPSSVKVQVSEDVKVTSPHYIQSPHRQASSNIAALWDNETSEFDQRGWAGSMAYHSLNNVNTEDYQKKSGSRPNVKPCGGSGSKHAASKARFKRQKTGHRIKLHDDCDENRLPVENQHLPIRREKMKRSVSDVNLTLSPIAFKKQRLDSNVISHESLDGHCSVSPTATDAAQNDKSTTITSGENKNENNGDKTFTFEFTFKPTQFDNTVRPKDVNFNPEDMWDKDFRLERYPRLQLDKPLQYTWTTDADRNPKTGQWDHFYPCHCYPVAPEDDIKKTLFLNDKKPNIRWAGEWAKAQLRREIAKYEAVKEFWLFEYADLAGRAFMPGLDSKYQFIATHFTEEMDSPWVQAWLGQLIGHEEVHKILQAMYYE